MLATAAISTLMVLALLAVVVSVVTLLVTVGITYAKDAREFDDGE